MQVCLKCAEPWGLSAVHPIALPAMLLVNQMRMGQIGGKMAHTHVFKPSKRTRKRALWISKVPRANWKLRENEDFRICEKKFHTSDYVIESEDSNSRCKRKHTSPSLTRKRLKCDAYPSVWPGSPNYLTKPATTPRPTSLSSSESCRLNEQALRMEEIIQDQFHSIGKLASKLDKTRLPVGLTEIKTEDYICFLSISLIEKPKVIYSFKIPSDLQFCAWYEGENIKTPICEVLSRTLNSYTPVYEILDPFDKKPEHLRTNAVIEDDITRFRDPRVFWVFFCIVFVQ